MKQKVAELLSPILEAGGREQQYYAVGVVINLSRSEVARKHLFEGTVARLLGLLEDKNIEDFELSGVALKALINLSQDGERWSAGEIERAH